jgi:hypothetical protein
VKLNPDAVSGVNHVPDQTPHRLDLVAFTVLVETKAEITDHLTFCLVGHASRSSFNPASSYSRVISTKNGLFVVIILYSAACGYDIHFPSILPLLKTSKGNEQICSTTIHPLAKNGRSNSGSGVYWTRCCSSMTSRIGGWKGVNTATRIENWFNCLTTRAVSRYATDAVAWFY